MNIYIPIEVKVRELEGRSLLAFEAASRGHSVILGGKEDTLALARKNILNPGIIHDKSLASGQTELLQTFRDNKHIITCQDEEHGLLDFSYDDFAHQRFSDETLELADALFCWGDHDTESLGRIYKGHINKFINTGSPRVDLWRNEFDYFFKDDSLPPYVLIVSNFGIVMNMNRIWSVLDQRQKWLDTSRFDIREFFGMYGSHAELLGEFIFMIRKLAGNIPGTQVILRPHPVEDINGWKSLLENSGENVKIIQEGGISKWIRNARAIIHNGCTSAFEATAGNIPVITYRPRISPHEREAPNMLGIEAYNSDEVINLVSGILKRKLTAADFKRNTSILSKRFSNLDGKFAFKSIVDHWESFNTQELSRPNTEFLNKRISENLSKRPGEGYLRDKVFNKINRLKSVVLKTRQSSNKKANQAFTTAHKFSNLEREELINLKNSYSNLFEDFNDIDILKIGKRAYLIRKK
jgi:surface carbohydrate biosynthesis protein